MNYKKINFMYSFIVICYVLCEGFFGYAFTAFMSSNGLSLASIGLLMAITDFSIMIFDYPSGNIADKYGRKKICSLGFVIYGISLLIFGISKSFELFLISGIVRALGSSLISGTPTAWYLGELSKIDKISYKDKFLPTIRGISLIFGSVSGIIAGNLSKINISLPIHLGGFIMIISAIIILFFHENYGTFSKKENLFTTIKKNTSEFFKDKNMRICAIFGIFKTFIFTIFILSWQIFATKKIGISYEKLGYLYTLMLILMSISSFFTKFLMEKLNKITVTIIGQFFLCLGLFIFSISNEFYLFLIGFIIFEFSFGIVNASYYTWLYDFIDENLTATYFSALSSIDAFAGFIISILSGTIIQIIGYSKSWLIAMLFGIFSIFVLLKMIKNSKKVK